MEQLKLIGRGLFSRVYDAGDEVIVLSNDMAKEVYALLRVDERYQQAPRVRFYDGRRELPEPEDGFRWYIMPKYKKLPRAWTKALNPEDLETFRKLRGLPMRDRCGYYRIFDALISLGLDDLADMASDVCNGIYPEDLLLEVSPRNVLLDDEGRAIWADLFFCRRAGLAARGL